METATQRRRTRVTERMRAVLSYWGDANDPRCDE
jgi:hypothetical protein